MMMMMMMKLPILAYAENQKPSLVYRTKVKSVRLVAYEQSTVGRIFGTDEF